MEAEAYLEMARIERDHWWFVARREIFADLIARLDLPADARILEVGSGTGGNLDLLRRFGTVSSFEMDGTAIAIARDKVGGAVDIRQGTCPDAVPFSGERFDLICLFDVLEHIEEDRETLTALKDLLAPGGRILLSVPANPWMFGPHDRFLHHKRRYTRRGLARTIDEGGLTPAFLTHFNTLLFPLAAAARLLDKLRGATESMGSAVPGTLLNGLFRGLFAAERHVLGRVPLPVGVSLLAVLTSKESA
ncbi:MAG: class I SAM-dependent methyltransferase [Alphaproteobacteria bacterium]|nr:class I SAM-dependent methyltransferase [Alphaproteobacteria bacterium]